MVKGIKIMGLGFEAKDWEEMGKEVDTKEVKVEVEPVAVVDDLDNDTNDDTMALKGVK
jgi:hypothetical protein